MSSYQTIKSLYDKYPILLALGSIVVLTLALLFWLYGLETNELTLKEVVRASSPAGGSYHQTLTKIVDYINANPNGLPFRLELQDIDSEGSTETLEQLSNDEVDLGLVQGNTILESPGVGALLQIYQEIYLFYTTHSVETLEGLCRKLSEEGASIRVGSLGPGSQVHIDLHNILQFYGVDEGQIVHRSMRYDEAAQALMAGEIDLAFIVGGYKNEKVRELASSPDVAILELTNIDALTANNYGISKYKLPAGLFGSGHPTKAISTVTTPAILVANSKLSTNLVLYLTRYLLKNKENLRKSFPQLDIQEIPGGIAALHQGAQRAYRPDRFWWISRYDGVIKFLASILGSVIAVASLAFQVWKHLQDKHSGNSSTTKPRRKERKASPPAPTDEPAPKPRE